MLQIWSQEVEFVLILFSFAAPGQEEALWHHVSRSLQAKFSRPEPIGRVVCWSILINLQCFSIFFTSLFFIPHFSPLPPSPSPGGVIIKEGWRRQLKVNWLPPSLKHPCVLFFLSPSSQNPWNTWFPNPVISMPGFGPLWGREQRERLFGSREREGKLKIPFPFYGKGTGIRKCYGKGREWEIWGL